MALKTDYKDDILDTTVNEKRKYLMINNSDGTVSFEDVTTYSQVGDSFGSSAVNEAFDNINKRNLKTYTSLAQLGLSFGDVTSPDKIPLALGGNARIDIQLDNASTLTLYNNGILPTENSGALTVINKGGRSEYIFVSGRTKGTNIYHRMTQGYITSTPIDWRQWEKANVYTEVIGTLTAGETSITLSDSTITAESEFDFYTSIYGVNPTAVTVSNGSITLTFDAQETNMNVEVRVM